MGTLFQDLRYASRLMIRSPGFTAVAVLTLALGIGATAGMFSVVNDTLLRPLPYPDADRLMLLWQTSPDVPTMTVSYPDFLDLRGQNRVFEDVAVYNRFHSMNLAGGEFPERVAAALVTENLFSLLRARPARGRTFLPEEDRIGGERVVVISDGLWQRRFGGDESLVGRGVTLDGESYSVIGIMPPEFAFPSGVDLWTPLGRFVDEEMLSRGNHPGLFGLARLRPGVAPERAQAEMRTIAERLAELYPGTNADQSVVVAPLPEVMVGGIRPTLQVLSGAVGFVLLIACTNVANLLLARGTSRGREFAVRIALGARRGRLLRQLLTESLLLSLAGGALGILLAIWSVDLLGPLTSASQAAAPAVVDRRVLGFTLVVAVSTSLLFGLAPAIQALRADCRTDVVGGGRQPAEPIRGRRLRSALVIGEIALALVLLAGAGLMMRSFVRLAAVDPGFTPEDLLTMRISVPETKYPDGRSLARLHALVLEKVGSLPGVTYTAVANALPFGSGGWQAGITIEGLPNPAPADNPTVDAAAISADYFRTLGIRLLQGRGFTERDDEHAAPVTVVSETMARRFWAGENPLGKRFKFGPFQAEGPWFTVVGVVGDVKIQSLEAETSAQFYVPYRQRPDAVRSASLVARLATDPAAVAAAIRTAITALDPAQPVYRIETMAERLSSSTRRQRVALTLMGIFSGVALLLSLAGIYGVISYLVARRSHEFGVRLALGARPSDLRRLVLGYGFRVTAAGCVIGVVASLALSRVLQSLLFDLSAADPATYGSVSAILMLAVLGGAYLPARRAMRVDPMSALRRE